MSNDVHPLEHTRYREAAGVLGRAFQNDPVVLAILKGMAPERRIEILTMAFDADLQICGPRGCPLEVMREERIAGAAIIHRPGGYPLPVSSQVGLLWKVFARGLLTSGAFAAFGRWLKWLAAIAKKHPAEPHFYLEFIGIDISWQGSGLGSQLLQRLADHADEDRVGCYLETGNQRNVPLFRRFGFQTTAEEEVVGIPTWFMWRPPAR